MCFFRVTIGFYFKSDTCGINHNYQSIFYPVRMFLSTMIVSIQYRYLSCLYEVWSTIYDIDYLVRMFVYYWSILISYFIWLNEKFETCFYSVLLGLSCFLLDLFILPSKYEWLSSLPTEIFSRIKISPSWIGVDSGAYRFPVFDRFALFSLT